MEKKNKKIKLMAIQIGSLIAQKETNIKRVKNILEESLAQKNPDFVFLPEVWTSGWDCPSFPSCAESFETGDAIFMLKEIAKKYNTNIIGGSLIQKKQNNTYSNTCPVINRNGTLVGTYEKNHLFSYYGCNESSYVEVGTKPIIANIDGIKIGLTICYDIRFPEIYRAYRKAGADILVNMAAWGASKQIPWDCMTKARAIENQTYFVALTQTGTLRDGTKNLGHSMIIDYKGEIIDEIDKIEGFIYAEVDLDEMYEFQNKCTILNDIKEEYKVEII